MAILDLQTGDIPILRKKARPVERIDNNLLQLIENMFETMHAAEGVGLAAPQIGVSQRVVVIDIESHFPECPPIALINPVITEATGEEPDEERCLSLPKRRGIVRRATSVTIEAILPDEQKIKLNGKHLMARVLQHEIDHLDGVLFIDLLKPEDQALLEEAENREGSKGTVRIGRASICLLGSMS